MPPSFIASIEAVRSTYVAPPNNNSTTGAAGGATSIDTTGATLLVAVVRANGSGASISDSEGNVWTYGAEFGPGITRVRLAWVFNPLTSATHTFNPTSNEGSADVFAFGGSGTWAQTEMDGATITSPGTSVTTDSIPTTDFDVVIAGLSSNGSISGGAVNNGFSGGIAGEPANALPQQLSGTPEVGMGAYLISPGGSTDTTFTSLTNNADWVWIIGSFTLTSPAPSGGGCGPLPIFPQMIDWSKLWEDAQG